MYQYFDIINYEPKCSYSTINVAFGICSGKDPHKNCIYFSTWPTPNLSVMTWLGQPAQISGPSHGQRLGYHPRSPLWRRPLAWLQTHLDSLPEVSLQPVRMVWQTFWCTIFWHRRSLLDKSKKHFYSGASSQFKELKLFFRSFVRWNFLSTLPSKVRSVFFRGSILGDGNPKGPSSLCPWIAIVITQRAEAGYSNLNGYDDVLGIFSGSNPRTEKNHDIPPKRKLIVQ